MLKVDETDSMNSTIMYSKLQNSHGQERMKLMREIVTQLQEQTKKHETARENTIATIEFVGQLKDVVVTIIEPYPPAALAVSAFFTIAPVLIRPIEQKKAMINGLSHVLQRLETYMGYVRLLFKDNYAGKDDFTAVQRPLRSRISNLYKRILEYQMMAVCRCYKDWHIKYVIKAMAGLEDWNSRLTAIKDLETEIRTDIGMYHSQVQESLLRSIGESTKELGVLFTKVAQTQDRQIVLQEQQIKRQLTENQWKLTSKFATNYLQWPGMNDDESDKPVKGTCQWLIKNHHFQRWLNEEPGILLFSAIAGCGKTVISRYLIDEYFPLQSPSRTICYFFFKDQSDEQKQLKTGICSILHQLFSGHGELAEMCQKTIEEAGVNLTSNLPVLWTIFEQTIRKIDNAICVLDGLDEMNQDDFKWLSSKLNNFYSKSTEDSSATGVVTRFILTTRDYQDITEKFDTVKSNLIRLKGEDSDVLDDIQPEIELVIENRLQRLIEQKDLINEPETIKAIREALNKRGSTQKTYLYVKILFEFLEKDDEEEVSEEYWTEKILNHVPPDLPTAYEKLLSQVKPAHREDVRTIFGLVLATAYPLSIRHLNAATTARKRVEENPMIKLETEKDLKMRPDKKFENWLRKRCKCFLTVYHDRVYFIHQTAKEFLLKTLTSTSAENNPSSTNVAQDSSKSEGQHKDKDWHHITMKMANAIVAECCIAYLSIQSMTLRPKGDWVRDELNLDKPSLEFSTYAATYSLQHYRLSQQYKAIENDQVNLYHVTDVRASFQRKASDLFRKQLMESSGETWLIQYLDFYNGDACIREIIRLRCLLGIYGLFGLYNLLLDEVNCSQDLSITEKEICLVAAAAGGETECVQLLLSREFPANLSEVSEISVHSHRDCAARTAFQWAAWRGNMSIALVLLKKKPDIISELSSTVTLIADCIPNLTRRFNINSPAHYLLSILLSMMDIVGPERDQVRKPSLYRLQLLGCRSADWNTSFLKLLKASKADMNAFDSRGMTPLFMACSRNSALSVKWLIQNCHVNVNHDCHFDGIAIFTMAFKFSDEEILLDLLNGGLDTSRTLLRGDQDNITALHDLYGNGSSIQNYSVETIRKVFEGGAKQHVNAHINKRNDQSISQRSSQYGWTPLHIFADSYKDIGDYQLFVRAEILFEYGANVDERDSHGRTPLHIAFDTHNVPTAIWLVNNGADINIPHPYQRHFKTMYQTLIRIVYGKGWQEDQHLIMDSNMYTTWKEKEDYIWIEHDKEHYF
jgi:ankyrin repeat protein